MSDSTQSDIVKFAKAQLGKPYVWGATGPNSYDCSGLVYAAYKAAGLPIVRLTASQWGKVGQAVSEAQAQPGDLVYYDEKGAVDHVGIYIGGGKMIDAPHSGARVEVDPVGTPTSFRHVDLSNRNTKLSDLPGDAAGAAVDAVTGAFSSSEVTTIALKVLAGAAVVGLAVIGMKQTVSGGN